MIFLAETQPVNWPEVALAAVIVAGAVVMYLFGGRED
jgi:hypothetical protein